MSASISPRSHDSPRSTYIVPLICIIFTIIMAVFSTGFFEPFDEVVHFLYARKVWSDPSALLSIWARLGCTGLYALTAPLGLAATRILAATVTMLVAIGATKVAKHFVSIAESRGNFFRRHYAAFTWILLFAQPCFAMNSFTTMTEMPLAAAWVWAAVMLLRGSRKPGAGVIAAAFFVGLGGLLRPEGWIAIAAWPAFVVVWLRVHQPRDTHLGKTAVRVLVATLLAGLPALAWYVAGAAHYESLRWVIAYWPWAAASPYGKTGLMFIGASAVALAIWMWPFAVGGIIALLKRAMLPPRHRKEAILLLALPFAAFFLMHGVLGSFGLFGSMSLPRYFIAVAPMGAILTLLGLIRCENAWPKMMPLLRAAAIGFPLLTIGGLIATSHLPSAKNLTTQRLDVAIGVIQTRIAPDQYQSRIIAAHPYILYALLMPLDEKGDIRTYSARDIENAAPGTLLLLEQNLWESEHRPSFAQLASWGYREDLDVAAKTNALQPTLPFIRMDNEVAAVHLWVKQK